MLKHVTVIIIYKLYLATLCECMRKNVCKTFEDYRTIQYNPNCWYNPDVEAGPDEIANRYGFPFETHQVTTKDGFVLTLFRIPHNGTNINEKRPAVVVQHGFAADGTTWMLLGSKSIVFVLAKNGYDVWISNSRGTKYSARHLKYSIFEFEYWNFSFHEMGLYDLPAFLEFIKQKTGQATVSYIGHSMGNTMAYIYSSRMPLHARAHLKSIVSLAPVVYMDHVRSLARDLVPFRFLIWNVLVSAGIYGVNPTVEFKFGIFRRLCSQYPLIIICNQVLGSAGGTSGQDTEPSNIPVGLARFPTGFSLKTMMHFAQIMATKRRFQMFDYGSRANSMLYNSSLPPEYPLSEIKVPVYLFYGKNDLLSSEKDVLHLYDKLETEKRVMQVLDLGHFDFLSGSRADQLYEMLLEYL